AGLGGRLLGGGLLRLVGGLRLLRRGGRRLLLGGGGLLRLLGRLRLRGLRGGLRRGGLRRLRGGLRLLRRLLVGGALFGALLALGAGGLSGLALGAQLLGALRDAGRPHALALLLFLLVAPED